jgi:uncharacterized protein YciI
MRLPGGCATIGGGRYGRSDEEEERSMKYAAFIQYGNQERIAEVRPKHRAYLSGLQERGALVASGPFSDDSGALIIYEAESEAAARRLIEADPFKEAGVFQSIELKEWRQVF